MEVKIGIVESARELVVSSDQSRGRGPEARRRRAERRRRLLRLVDDKGRRFLVRADQIAYVEIAPEDGRKVGFAIG